MNKENENILQTFTTLLAFFLPLIQFFFGKLTSSVKDVFLFQRYFVLVSIFTAIVSYILVLVLRLSPWFEWAPFQRRRKRKILLWDLHTNLANNASDDVRAYQETHKQPRPLNSIKSENITLKVFLPLVIISFGIFMYLGLRYGATAHFEIHNGHDVLKAFAQALAYSVFLIFAVLSFAHHYLRDGAIKRMRIANSNKSQKVIELARRKNAFEENKDLSLLAEKSFPAGGVLYMGFMLKVDQVYYVVVTDFDVDTIALVQKFNTQSEAEASLFNAGGQQ